MHPLIAMSRVVPSCSTLSPSHDDSIDSNQNLNYKSFHSFFQCWLSEQNQLLQELISASERQQMNSHDSLEPLIDRVLNHYEKYYSVKSKWAKLDVLTMFSPSWTSSLEDAFLWIGGWRPSMAFHLVYSKSGLQLEDQLHDLIRGLSTNDLGDLSPNQLKQLDEFQRRVIKEEKDISEKMAKVQESLADPSMVELTHEITSVIMEEEGSSNNGSKLEERVECALAPKREGLEEMLQRADDLRLRTLTGVIKILSPNQIVHFLIAAAELHLRLHELGKKRDANKHVE